MDSSIFCCEKFKNGGLAVRMIIERLSKHFAPMRQPFYVFSQKIKAEFFFLRKAQNFPSLMLFSLHKNNHFLQTSSIELHS